jgi:hypothetical protein
MPVPAKLVTLLGLLGKEEATYGTAIALTTTSDGLLMQFTDRNIGAPASIEYAYDGDLGPSVASGATTKRAAPAGRSFRAAIPFRAKGAGSAYAAATVPNLHKIIKASGFDAALTSTTSSEKYTYTPTSEGVGYTSLTLNAYARGELWAAAGCVGNLSINFDNQAPPVWTFDVRGIASVPTDAAVPAITYPSFSTIPPLASSATVVIGSFTTNAVVLGGSFTFNRGIDNPRVPISGTHLGFVPSGRGPRMTLTVEQTAFVGSPFHTSAGIDPTLLREAATSITVSIAFGSTQYNRYTIAMATAQLVNVTPANKGPTATVTLEFAGHGSTPTTNDDCSITFD